MLLEKATVSLAIVKNFITDGRFLRGIEDCSISEGRTLIEEMKEEMGTVQETEGCEYVRPERATCVWNSEMYLKGSLECIRGNSEAFKCYNCVI